MLQFLPFEEMEDSIIEGPPTEQERVAREEKRRLSRKIKTMHVLYHCSDSDSQGNSSSSGSH